MATKEKAFEKKSNDDRVVILGAGRSIKGGSPSAIAVTDKDHRVLDWILNSFSVLGNFVTSLIWNQIFYSLV